MDHFAGLDVSVKETSICIVDDAGKIVREVKVASEPEALLAVLKNFAYHFKRIGLEAGPLSQWLSCALAEAGLPVICVETRHMQAVLKAQINKTDRTGPTPGVVIRRRHTSSSRTTRCCDTELRRKEPLDDTSGSVRILAIDVSDTATPLLRADHSQLPLRREIPEHGSDQQKRRHVANQVTCLVSVMRGLYCHDAGVHDARPDRE